MVAKLTKEQAAIIGAYTGISCAPFSVIHEKIEQVLGRPVWTHELASKDVWAEVKDKVKAEFLELCYDDPL